MENITESFTFLKNEFPENNNDLSILEIYCETLIRFEEKERIKEFTEDFNEIILKSDINDSSKKIISDTAILGAGSFIIWEELE